MDGQHPGPGVGGAHGAGMDHAGQVQVVGIFPIAQHLFPHIQPVYPGAHLPFLRGLGDPAFPQNLGGQLHRVHDFHIAGAAADVIAQGVGDLLPGRAGVLVQQGLGAHDHARDAETALHGPCLAKGIGVRVLFKVRKAFHRQDGFALHAVGLLDAAFDGLAVDEDGAGAASAFAATVLHRGQVQGVPQIAHEFLILFHGHGLTVYGEGCHGLRILSSFNHTRQGRGPKPEGVYMPAGAQAGGLGAKGGIKADRRNP